MQNKNKPLFLSPYWLKAVGAHAAANYVMVYAVPYTSTGREVRVWKHRTLKAAGRRMGSVISGKLAMRGDQSVFAIAPDGTIHNWCTANGRPGKTESIHGAQ